VSMQAQFWSQQVVPRLQKMQASNHASTVLVTESGTKIAKDAGIKPCKRSFGHREWYLDAKDAGIEQCKRRFGHIEWYRAKEGGIEYE